MLPEAVKSRTREGFAKPVLYLVIAEDEEYWSEKLTTLAEHLRQWSLSRTGQFDLEVRTCQSVEAFKELVSLQLDAEALVYATLDLGMPLLKSDDRFSDQAGKEMVLWCLEQRRRGKRLEFCLVSGLEASLDRLYRQSPELESQRVKRIYKSAIEGWPEAQARLLDMVSDIQNFVRRHLPFGTVKLPGSTETVPIWFGGEEPLVALLGRAERIASAKEAGVYILFADAGGYEIDWARLCCELRGLRLKEFDIFAKTPESREWLDYFENPPAALLVRNLDYARDRRCEIAPLLEGGFFDKVEQRNSLVFFQFPFSETQLDALKRLDEDVEQPILDACLRYIYKEDVGRHQDTSFVFENHRRILTLPTFEALRNAGVVRNTIQFQLLDSSRQMGCESVEIDPELFEVLAEIPWDRERMGGLQQLRESIRTACESYSAGKRSGKLLSEESFKGDKIVPKEFRGELGFLVRGRWLYDLLENRHSRGAEPWGGFSDPEQALENLETLWTLYDGLDQLQQLGQQWGELGQQPSRTDFTAEDYKALYDAWGFLDKLFENPTALRQKIEKFRDHMTGSAWRSYYPNLETRKSKTAVENLRFSWPFTRLPLNPAVAAYLLRNRVRALIHREIGEYLDRYPDLASTWDENERTRDALFEVIMQREEQREAAEAYTRERHNQPVLVHLVPRMNPEERRSTFEKILNSFLLFNTYLALAENHYIFASGVIKSSAMRRVLTDRVDIGPMVGFLCDYTKRLGGYSDRSLFHRWTDDWAVRGEQKDALRLMGRLAGAVLSDPHYQDSLGPDDRPSFESFAQFSSAMIGESKAGPCGVGHLLNLFRIIRNAFYKGKSGAFEQTYGRDLRDLLRRLVKATTADFRIGKIGDEGDSIHLWRKEPFESSETASMIAGSSAWIGRLVVAEVTSEGEIDSYRALFPIDDLMVVREKWDSLWAYYKDKSVWKNLTHVEGSEEGEEVSADRQDWLPQKDKLTSSDLWQSVHKGAASETGSR